MQEQQRLILKETCAPLQSQSSEFTAQANYPHKKNSQSEIQLLQKETVKK